MRFNPDIESKIRIEFLLDIRYDGYCDTKNDFTTIITE